jgi:beta-xylosidase
MFSPSLVSYDGELAMIYTAWHANTPTLRSALSSDGGRTWVRNVGPPLLEPSDKYAWMNNSVDEADVELGPGGVYYLFFTAGSLARAPQNSIGMARSSSPFGPWQIYPHPIVQQRRGWELEDMGYPTVVPDGSTARLWYGALGLYHHETTAPGFQFRIAYAVSSLP